MKIIYEYSGFVNISVVYDFMPDHIFFQLRSGMELYSLKGLVLYPKQS